MTDLQFPDGFVWGVATSSYQIEGAAREDGRGESIWDRFSNTPGKVIDGSNGDIACDHYHRFIDDVALMKSLNVAAYRFSIAWPRVLPEGRGTINQNGLDFYSRLVDALLDAGIRPFATLYHWDLPQALENEGGWSRRSTAEAFVGYVEAVVRHLGDRVGDWITHNEPWCASMLGYERGIHAPGIVDKARAIAASHHLLLSHGWALPVIRAESSGARAGITLNLGPMLPASDSAADHDAARHADGHFNRWFLDPVFGRGYPDDMVRDYVAGGFLPAAGMTMIEAGDLDAIAARTDFLGVNYYNRTIVRSDAIPESANETPVRALAPREEWTEMGWEVYPPGLHQTLMRVHLHYGPRKMYVTENGCSFSTGPDAEGRIADSRRVEFFRDHLRAGHRAIADGAPLAGYFAWSLMDNFEWERGYGQRFGIVHVDYESQVRRPKDSAAFLAKVFARNAVLALFGLGLAGCYDSVVSEDGNASGATIGDSGDEVDDSSTGDDGSTSSNDDASTSSDDGSSSSSDDQDEDSSSSDAATTDEDTTTGEVPNNGYYVQGNAIYASNDQVHVFRGIDRPSLEWNSNGEGIAEADIDLIAGWNANVVRIALNQGFWLEGSVAYDPTYRDRIDQVVQWSKDAGMDVILDLHWSDKGNLQQWPGQQRMADQNSRTFWQSVADRYKDDGRVLFELYNEPHDVAWSVWLEGGDSGDGFQVVGMQELYDTVRAAGADNLVLIGGLNYAYDLSGVPDHRVEGYNIVYTTHPYDFDDKQPAAWDADWGFLAESDPIFVTEFGSFNCNAGYAQQLIDYAEQRGLSWSAWAWYPGGCGFPALIENWSGTPSAVGQIVKTGLEAN